MKTKKELKEQYKQMKFPAGVFQVRNTTNNKIFVEGSVILDAIWNRHRVQLNFGNHPNEELQKDWKELGESHFKFEIPDTIDPEKEEIKYPGKEVKSLEAIYIEELRPFGEKGYNQRPKSYRSLLTSVYSYR